MRIARRIVLVLVAGLAILLVIAESCRRLETFESEYATYAEAERAGAVDRGWIPRYVPRSATEIEEVHDLDTNGQRLRFRAPVRDLEAMVEGMLRLTREEAEHLGGRAAGSESGLEFYRDTTVALGAGCVAIDSRKGEAYAWTC